MHDLLVFAANVASKAPSVTGAIITWAWTLVALLGVVVNGLAVRSEKGRLRYYRSVSEPPSVLLRQENTTLLYWSRVFMTGNNALLGVFTLIIPQRLLATLVIYSVYLFATLILNEAILTLLTWRDQHVLRKAGRMTSDA